MNVFIKKGIFSYMLYIYIYIFIYILFLIFCMLMLARQKITSGFFLLEAEQKAKNEKKKKRQEKLIQKAENVKIASCSSSGETTVTDEEK